ncbi:MAG: hypothetical protein ABMB14_21470 [Myxococcota bacterium]
MLSILQHFSHKAEIRESKDEILVGEIVRAMARQGFPTIQFLASDDLQRIRFKTLGDPVLNSAFVTVDRKTGTGALTAALIGSKATLRITAELKNRMADPDDLVAMYRTDLANLFKLPVLGGIRLNHELNSVLATTQQVIDIDEFVSKGEPGVQKLVALLQRTLGALRDKLAPYKKDAR